MSPRTRAPLFAFLAVATYLGALAGFGQPTNTLRRVCFLSPGFSQKSEEAESFRTGLREAGYVEGRNVTIEWWYGSGSYAGIPGAVEDAVRRKPDVIVVESTVAALAVKQATSTIPIVLALVGDPVGSGLVTSLARPGGNITGLSNQTVDLTTKQLELIKEAIPKASRVAILWHPDTSIHVKALEELRHAARDLHL